MHVLFLFFDGFGLGDDNADNNPLAVAEYPALMQFTGGQRWLRSLPRIEDDISVFIPTDVCLGVEGKPQSATGQAAIMTGKNVPEMIGRHYGPKPTPDIIEIVEDFNIANNLAESGYDVRLLNAYPSRFLESIESGKRLPSSNQYAMLTAGAPLLSGQAFLDGQALSVDFTGKLWRGYPADNDAATIVWREKLNRTDTPVMHPQEAGKHLAKLAQQYDFAFFDHWLTDYLGHRGTMEQGLDLLEVIDGVFDGLLENWNVEDDIIILTSDHGNFENLNERGHTFNPVPTLIIGRKWSSFFQNIADLTHIAPALLQAFNGAKSG